MLRTEVFFFYSFNLSCSDATSSIFVSVPRQSMLKFDSERTDLTLMRKQVLLLIVLLIFYYCWNFILFSRFARN